MAIFRGVGGSGDSSDNSFLDAVTAQANSASASASAASASAVLAQASADSILTLTAATGDAGTDVSYNASTGVLTVPRGADGSDASVTAANVTGVLTGGTGISIASNGTITNDSPDQTVALTGTGATTVTGTYPNFTIDSTNTTYTVGDGGLTTNDFTDADHSKLNGIEANADVTDTANVTAAGAAMLTGATFTGNVSLADNNKALFGDSDDLQIYHDGSNSYVADEGTGVLNLKAEIIRAGLGNQGYFDFIRSSYTPGSEGLRIGVGSSNQHEIKSLGNRDLVLERNDDEKLRLTSTGIDVTGNIAVSGTVDGRDLSADGAKLDTLERVYRRRFSKNAYSYSNSIASLTSSYLQISPTIIGTFTTGSENELDFYITAIHNDINSANEFLFYVNSVAPSPSSEDTVNLGTVSDVVTAGSIRTFAVSGDITKHLSPYCGMSTTSTGANAFGFDNNHSWYYDSIGGKTIMTTYNYQSNTPSNGDTLYLHPFDWESSGTQLTGDFYPADAYNASGTVNIRRDYKVYLGYHKNSPQVSAYARETTSSESIVISAVGGVLTQYQD